MVTIVWRNDDMVVNGKRDRRDSDGDVWYTCHRSQRRRGQPDDVVVIVMPRAIRRPFTIAVFKYNRLPPLASVAQRAYSPSVIT